MSEYLYQAFFYRYLAQAKLTVSLLKSFKYVVTKGKDFNCLFFFQENDQVDRIQWFMI